MIYGGLYLKEGNIRFYEISSKKLIKDMVHETISNNKYIMINPIVINNYLLLGNRGKKIDVINCDNREFIEPIKIEHDYIMISFFDSKLALKIGLYLLLYIQKLIS